MRWVQLRDEATIFQARAEALPSPTDGSCCIAPSARTSPLDNSKDETIVAHHEMGFCLEMRLPDHLEAADTFMGSELAGTEDEVALEFWWFPRGELGEIDVRPSVLEELLAADAPAGVPALVHRSRSR